MGLSLIHPIAPRGCELIREYLNVDENVWNWELIFEPITTLMDDAETHELKFLEPRFDFFEKHESQFRK